MGQNPSQFAGDVLPVERVSHDDATEFCKRLSRLEGLPESSYRLPTEAEWEYAALGVGQVKGLPGSLDECAWFKDNAGRRTHPVGQKRPNTLNLYDLAGNVAEWCSDWLGVYDPGEQRDPSGPVGSGAEKRRVLRGGSWIASSRACRPSDRDGAVPGGRLGLYGFRVVREATRSQD
jgi:formylglycine-generating enzyme required for sulfatase activity